MPGAAEDRSRAVAARPVQALSGGGGLVRAPFRYPKLTATLLLWALGLFLAFLARPPAITPEATAAFMSKIKEVRSPHCAAAASPHCGSFRHLFAPHISFIHGF